MTGTAARQRKQFSSELCRNRPAHGGPIHQPPLWHVVILNGTVLDRAVVPHQHVTPAPLMAINESRLDDVIGQCSDQRFRFFCPIPSIPTQSSRMTYRHLRPV